MKLLKLLSSITFKETIGKFSSVKTRLLETIKHKTSETNYYVSLKEMQFFDKRYSLEKYTVIQMVNQIFCYGICEAVLIDVKTYVFSAKLQFF